MCFGCEPEFAAKQLRCQVRKLGIMTETLPEKLDHKFRFGEGWDCFQDVISEGRLSNAIKTLGRFMPENSLKDKTMPGFGLGSHCGECIAREQERACVE